VPEKGRGIFKGGNDLNDSDIEPFNDHDVLMEEAGRKVIKFSIPKEFSKEQLDEYLVIDNWKNFERKFKKGKWACCSNTSFRWQNNQKVWMHLVLMMEPEMRDIPRPIAWVRVSSIVDFLTDVERIALFSFLRSRHKQFGLEFDIPKKYMRYACLVGADRKILKKGDLEELLQGGASKFISGYYYSKGFHY
jgi:hypothetical protein